MSDSLDDVLDAAETRALEARKDERERRNRAKDSLEKLISSYEESLQQALFLVPNMADIDCKRADHPAPGAAKVEATHTTLCHTTKLAFIFKTRFGWEIPGYMPTSNGSVGTMEISAHRVGSSSHEPPTVSFNFCAYVASEPKCSVDANALRAKLEEVVKLVVKRYPSY